jgi:hypothetical protein
VAIFAPEWVTPKINLNFTNLSISLPPQQEQSSGIAAAFIIPHTIFYYDLPECFLKTSVFCLESGHQTKKSNQGYRARFANIIVLKRNERPMFYDCL